jgi:hypothetical protein
MLISLHRHGGLAAIPGLEIKVAVNTSDLPRAEAEELEMAARNAALGELPSSPASARGADRRIYELAVQDGNETQSVTLTDPVQHPGARELIRLLTNRSRQR